MSTLHKAPFKNNKVIENLNAMAPLLPGEDYLLYYDDSNFGKANSGLVLTTLRLMHLKERAVLAELTLEAITQMGVFDKSGAGQLSVYSTDGIIQASFILCTERDAFKAELAKKVQVPEAVKIDHATALMNSYREAVNDPNNRTRFESAVSLAEAEVYKAFYHDPWGLGNPDLLVTNQRVLCIKKGQVNWSMQLRDIQKIDYPRVINHYKLTLFSDEKKFEMEIIEKEPDVCEALMHLVREAQGENAGNLAPKAQIPEVAKATPITALMNSFREAVDDPTNRRRYKSVTPYAGAEVYKAYYQHPMGFGDPDLLITDQRVICVKKEQINWSVRVNDIQKIEYAKFINFHTLTLFCNEKKFELTIPKKEPDICTALKFLILEAQGKYIGNPDGIYLVSSTTAAIPISQYFIPRQSTSPVLDATLAFPRCCAWCKSREIVQERETTLFIPFHIDTSMAKKVSGLVLGTFTLIGGLLLYNSGNEKDISIRVHLAVPACAAHVEAQSAPAFSFEEGDRKRKFFFLNLRDPSYAEEFCRVNNP